MFLKAGGHWLRLDAVLHVHTEVVEGLAKAEVTLAGMSGGYPRLVMLTGTEVAELLTGLERVQALSERAMEDTDV